MTFCPGVKVNVGLVGIADTRITSGTECITARQLTVFEREGQSLFIMTSVRRSLRDKAVTYFEEVFDEQPEPFDRLFKAVNAFATQVRRVAEEDKEALAAAGLFFDMNVFIGGERSH